MATYAELQVDEYYLITETEGAELELVKPLMETEKALMICMYDDGYENTMWVKKSDEIFEVVEQLSLEKAIEFEDQYEDDDDFWLDDEELEGFEIEDEELEEGK